MESVKCIYLSGKKKRCKFIMRNLAICISLANLFFIEVWIRLIYDRSPWNFFASHSLIDYKAIIINVIVLGVVLWLALKLLENYPQLRVAGIMLFGLVFVVIFKSLALIILLFVMNFASSLPGFSSESFVPIVIMAVLIGVFICLIHYYVTKYYSRQLTTIVPTALLILFPFALFTISQAVWVIIKYNPNSATEQTSADFHISNENPRVVWLIFDEMDHRVTFDERPETVALPEIDRFRDVSIYATEAYPPGASTAISLPSLTTGKQVVKVKSSSLCDLELYFIGNENPSWWSSELSIFEQAKKIGFRTAVGGWAIPYHIVFNDSLDITIPGWRGESTIIDKMYCQAMDVIPFVDRYRKRAADAHQLILKHTKKAIMDIDINLVFIHFMPPHEPWIYDRSEDHYNYNIITSVGVEPEGHFDNLVLVDRTIGVLREKMESEGLWDQTTILISSDHWWRSSHEFDGITDHRVPFLLKLAGQTESIVFETPFNTLLSHDLILSILQNDLSTPEEIYDWLERNHLRYEIPEYTLR